MAIPHCRVTSNATTVVCGTKKNAENSPKYPLGEHKEAQQSDLRTARRPPNALFLIQEFFGLLTAADLSFPAPPAEPLCRQWISWENSFFVEVSWDYFSPLSTTMTVVVGLVDHEYWQLVQARLTLEETIVCVLAP